MSKFNDFLLNEVIQFTEFIKRYVPQTSSPSHSSY